MDKLANRSVFRKLIKLIDGNIGRKLRKANNEYKYSKCYTGRDHILTMLFLQISGCDGLRDINAKYKNSSKISKDFNMPSYSQISRLNKSKSSDLFRNVFEELLVKADKEMNSSVKIKNFKDIKIIDSFKKTTITIYGKEQEVSYYCINLLWGQKLYQELRFVLVSYNGINSILVSTDLMLNAETIIRLYSYRFKIECTFRELKQVIGAFSYQFWCKSMPKLNRFKKKTEIDSIDKIEDQKVKERILSTLNAIEMYVMCSCIAIGLLQIIALSFSATELSNKFFRYLRTPSKEIVSEATVACYLRKNIFRIMAKNAGLSITKIIKNKQVDPLFYEDLQAS